MIRLLRELRLYLLPPISRSRALAIAGKHSGSPLESLVAFSKKPERCHGYMMPDEPCWYVYAPWNDGKDGTMLRSSRVILVCKMTGRILYDGGAGDEG